MFRTWQSVFLILHDAAAMTCMTAVLAAARGCRERKRSVTAVCYAASLLLSVLNVFLFRTVSSHADAETAYILYGGVSLLSVIVLPQIVLRAARPFSSALICLALNVGMEGLFSVFGYMLHDVDAGSYLFYETVFCEAGYLLIALFLRYVSKNKDLKIVRNTVELIPKWLYGVIIVCAFSSYFSIMGQAPELYSFEKVSGFLRAASVFGVLLFTGYFVFQVFALMAKQNQVLLQMNTQQRSYEKLLQNDEQLRRFRHDWKNHMLVVTSLLSAGQTDEATAYLEKIKVTSGIAEKNFLTGNLVADAILNNKKTLAGQQRTELSFTGTVPEKGIEYDDLCTVLGNLLDNALEGTKNLEGERTVRIRAVVRDGYLTVSVTNPVSKRIPIRNNRIKTTKTDARSHGIGLKNVAAAAKKYNGHLLLSCSETTFTADVTMRLQDEPVTKQED